MMRVRICPNCGVYLPTRKFRWFMAGLWIGGILGITIHALITGTLFAGG